MSRSKNPGKETLESLYITQGLSCVEVGNVLGVGRQVVTKYLKEHGIPMRAPWESRMLVVGTTNPGPAALREMYEVQRMTCKEIAERCESDAPTVHRWLKRSGIRTRTKAEARQFAKPPVYTPKGLEGKRAAAAAMRGKITAESHARQAAKMKGRPAPNKGVPHSEEHKAKLRAAWDRPGYREMKSQALRGDKAPNWKGGVKPEIAARLDRYEWRQIRQLVYARDNWTCQDCRCKCKNSADSKNDGKKKIQAHHVVARRKGGTDDLANLVTLCMSCHHKRERLGT